MAQKGKIREMQERITRQQKVIDALSKYCDEYKAKIKELEMKVTLGLPSVSEKITLPKVDPNKIKNNIP